MDYFSRSDSSICNSLRRNECVVEKWYIFGQIQGVGKRELIGTSSFTVTLTEPQILFSKRRLTFRVDVCADEDKLQQTGVYTVMYICTYTDGRFLIRILIFEISFLN